MMVLYCCCVGTFRLRQNSGRAELVVRVPASVTGCTRSEHTVTRWWRRACPRSSEQTLPARCCRWRPWASTTCCRLTSWTHLRCRLSSPQWNSCTDSVLSTTRGCLHVLVDEYVSLIYFLFVSSYLSDSVIVSLRSSHVSVVNNNNNHNNIYCAVIMTEIVARVHSVHLVNVEQCQVTANPQPSHLTWAVSPPVLGSYHLQPPSPFIIVTQPKSWYSFTVPRRVEGWIDLGTAGRCTQPVPKAVNHSGFYNKHNCPQLDSIPGPRALQSGTLPLDHCDLRPANMGEFCCHSLMLTGRVSSHNCSYASEVILYTWAYLRFCNRVKHDIKTSR